MKKLYTKLNTRREKWLAAIGAGLFWLALWQLAAVLADQELLIPAPAVTARILWAQLALPSFWHAVAGSVFRVIAGFFCAVIAGCLLAVLTARFRLARVLLSPALQVVRAVPVASFILLAYVWFSADALPVFISFLMVLPLIWANVEQGIHRTDRKLLEMSAVYRLSRRRIWLHIRIPSVMPYLLAACTTGLGFAWKAAVAAEILRNPVNAIGRLLWRAKATYDQPEVFAYTAVVVVLSILLERLLLAAVRRLGPRFGET
ncbi:MAG: ABC transporter permease subunit [Oscillospiraceae bacterium]|nr:ABC transporter permease subunit [Oscillospiraceae bacterium]